MKIQFLEENRNYLGCCQATLSLYSAEYYMVWATHSWGHCQENERQNDRCLWPSFRCRASCPRDGVWDDISLRQGEAGSMSSQWRHSTRLPAKTTSVWTSDIWAQLKQQENINVHFARKDDILFLSRKILTLLTVNM